jgi:prolyl 4-hydroxylase
MQHEHDARYGEAQSLERAGNIQAARALYAQAAKSGHIGALAGLAKNLLVREPLDIPNGIGMLRGAADAGDGEAAALCAALAGQDEALPGRWEVALDYLRRAAHGGFGPARAQLGLLSQNGDWQGPVDLARWLAPPAARTVFEAPHVMTLPGFASAALCDWLVETAKPRRTTAEIYDPRGGGQRRDDIRNNSAVSFDITQFDLILVLLRARAAALMGVPVHDFEPPMVLHYAQGQQFAPHFDYIEPLTSSLVTDVAQHGQRVATFLLTLNDGFEGGETAFPELDWSFKGAKGDALLFWSADAQGRLDRASLHAGAPVTSGEKWILSQWIRRPA